MTPPNIQAALNALDELRPEIVEHSIPVREHRELLELLAEAHATILKLAAQRSRDHNEDALWAEGCDLLELIEDWGTT